MCGALLEGPQVVEPQTDQVELARAIGGDAAAQQERDAQARRQEAWLKRGRAADGDKADWRPKKKHRASTRRWIILVDNAALSLGPTWPQLGFGAAKVRSGPLSPIV